MKTFMVIYKEVLLHQFFVDAETENEVDGKLAEMANEGELDFSHGEIDYGGIENIEEV